MEITRLTKGVARVGLQDAASAARGILWLRLMCRAVNFFLWQACRVAVKGMSLRVAVRVGNVSSQKAIGALKSVKMFSTSPGITRF